LGNFPGIIIKWRRVGHAGISRAISATREGAGANKRLLDVSFPRRYVPWNETSIINRPTLL